MMACFSWIRTEFCVTNFVLLHQECGEEEELALPTLILRRLKVSHIFFLKVTCFRILLILKNADMVGTFPLNFIRASKFGTQMWLLTISVSKGLVKLRESRNED